LAGVSIPCRVTVVLMKILLVGKCWGLKYRAGVVFAGGWWGKAGPQCDAAA
jgi:hypothetical protein